MATGEFDPKWRTSVPKHAEGRAHVVVYEGRGTALCGEMDMEWRQRRPEDPVCALCAGRLRKLQKLRVPQRAEVAS